ncbi:MAG: tyrosine-type recombinase/integrase [Rubrobacter sp.]|nr:tyrosine-type recombinase/integrase [Rubrobacter sp.]MBA3953147.1 tyrosine-type recombinase/integrase [Rubrobacter sp.]MDQ3636924.1 tyrosine-type recombinase/integrase [Actinomycetota bacterium]
MSPLPELAAEGGYLAEEILIGQDNPVLSYLGRLSEGSRRTMRGSLEEIAAFASRHKEPDGKIVYLDALSFPWWRLTSTHTALIRAYLAGKYAPSTANKMLSAMKGVLKACFRLGLMAADERDRASDVAPVKGTRLPPGRSIPRGELSALFAACTKEAEDPKMRARGVRDAAMLALLYVGGLRRTELASLRLKDYDPEGRTVRIRGKGNKERQVYAEGGAELLLESWLELRGEGESEEPLFLPVRKDGLVQHLDPHGEKKASLSDQAVYKMVKRRHREAKIKEVSPHDFRKTFVGDLLDAIGDLSTVQKLAGHSDPATTARYDRRGERAMREAASHLHVPHFGD